MPHFQAEDGIRDHKSSRGLGDVYKRQNKKSFAAEIVKKYTKFKKKIPIIFPMARKDVDPDEIWSNAVEKIVKFIQNGESVVLLCLGDTSLFASSSNILRLIKNNHAEIITKTIPGISSISAAAALNDFDLVKKGETLIIKECPSSESELTTLISCLLYTSPSPRDDL